MPRQKKKRKEERRSLIFNGLDEIQEGGFGVVIGRFIVALLLGGKRAGEEATDDESVIRRKRIGFRSVS